MPTGRTPLKRSGPLKTKKALTNKKPLTAKTGLKRSTPLKSSSTLKNSSSLQSGTRLKQGEPLKTNKPLTRKAPLENRASLQRSVPLKVGEGLERVELKYRRTVRKQKRKGPPVDADYLAFVRTFPCFHCGLESLPEQLTQPHHFEASGTGTKCSDYDTVPLCNYCHNHLWHQHRTFPGGTTAEWKEKFRENAKLLLAQYQAEGSTLLQPGSKHD